MQLRDYRAKHQISQTEMATALGVSQGAVSLIERGGMEPSGKLARKIVSVTNGDVTFEDLYTQQQAA